MAVVFGTGTPLGTGNETGTGTGLMDVDFTGLAFGNMAGAGALGNEVVKNLALLGIGSMLVADFDTIEVSNLSRSVLFREADLGRRKAEVVAQRLATFASCLAALIRCTQKVHFSITPTPRTVTWGLKASSWTGSRRRSWW